MTQRCELLCPWFVDQPRVSWPLGSVRARTQARGKRGTTGVLRGAELPVPAAQVIAALGLGARFPWSVPSLLSGTAGPEQASPGALGIAEVVVVGVAASVATVVWWEQADHNR